MIDEHKVFFEWPHSEPTEVIVCGSFNDWARTCHLTKGPTGFTGFIYVPWGSKITYKYVVDGIWSIRPEEPTERDEDGNLNNMYIAPSQPDTNGKPAPAESQDKSAGNVSQMVAHSVTAHEGIDTEQIALPTPIQSTVNAEARSDVTGSPVFDGPPIPSVPAEAPSFKHHVSENPTASSDLKAALTSEFPEKKPFDIPVPIIPANTAEDHTVSTPGADLAITPTKDGVESIHTVVRVNEGVPVAVEDITSKVEGSLMTVEEPHTIAEKTPTAEPVLSEKENTSQNVDVPMAAAGDKASLMTSEDPASTPEELSRETSQVLKTPEAITPASDLNPSSVLTSEGMPTTVAPSPEEKPMPQDMPIVPVAPLQKELDKLEQTEPAPVAYEVKAQPAPVLKPGHSLETSDVVAGPEIVEAVLEPAAEPQAEKEVEESIPVLSLPAGQILASQSPQKAVENGAEPVVEPRPAKQEKKVPETETIQSGLTPVSTQVSAPVSKLLPASVQTTGVPATETTSASTVEVAPTEMGAPATEPRPAADIRSAEENPSASPVAQYAPTPIIQAIPLELGSTSPIMVSEAAPEPAPKTEAAPISRSESAPIQDASDPAAPSNGYTEEAAVLVPASDSAKKAFPSTASPTASPSKSGKAVPERKKKPSIFGRIKHFFESDKGKSKN